MKEKPTIEVKRIVDYLAVELCIPDNPDGLYCVSIDLDGTLRNTPTLQVIKRLGVQEIDVLEKLHEYAAIKAVKESK